jgi:hypothetical protein
MARYSEYMTDPNGTWLRSVQLHCAKRDGFVELARSLQAREDADRAAWRAGFKSFYKSSPETSETLKDKCYASPGAGRNETLIRPTKLTRIADRIRALKGQNDPDIVRAQLDEIADALEGLSLAEAALGLAKI